MNRRKTLMPALAAAMLATILTGCGATREATPAPAAMSPSETATESAPPVPTPTESAAADPIVGTVVRFTSDRTTVDVTIGEDNPTVRDFLGLLPVEVGVEEFSGREKIASLSRALTTEGSPGSDPEDGDLIYFAPWGNLGFYYNADGIGYSDATIRIGSYAATADQLALLEGSQVTVRIVNE